MLVCSCLANGAAHLPCSQPPCASCSCTHLVPQALGCTLCAVPCLQFDIHSSQTTVREALQFSAHLRTKHSKDTTKELVETFIDEVSAPEIFILVGLHQVQTGRGPSVMRSVSRRAFEPQG